MKTTIELPAELLHEAQELARQEGRTLRELVETGLREVIAAQRSGEHEFVLEDASVAGNGVNPEFRDGGWQRIRDAAYRDA